MKGKQVTKFWYCQIVPNKQDNKRRNWNREQTRRQRNKEQENIEINTIIESNKDFANQKLILKNTNEIKVCQEIEKKEVEWIFSWDLPWSYWETLFKWYQRLCILTSD